MDKDVAREIIEWFKQLRDGFIKFFTDVWEKIKSLFIKKERPKNVTDVHDYLEEKKKSKPFYKAVNGNRKPWE